MIYVLVAMIMVWLIEALKERNLKSVVSIVISIALYPSVGFVTSATANYFDLNPNIGEPKTVWFAMGMQKPSKQSPNNYGWYNGFPLTWKPERYDVSQVERDSMESIKRSMRDFAADPAYAFNFFSKKYISEWTDPLYESLLASNWSIHGATRPTMSKRPMTKVQRSVYYGKGNRIILYVTDVLQFLLLLGATVSLFYNRKTMQIGSLSLAIIPVGMALLYLFWEAQSQYIMPAYIMMIPYAGSGLTFIGRTILCVTKKLISYARPSYA